MAKSNVTLKKTCSSCGKEKPLSAFLQLDDLRGAVYSNICSACRQKAKHEKPDVAKETGEGTRSTSGLKIDPKAKVEGEKKKRDAREKNEEEYFEEREQQEEKQIKISNKHHQIKENQNRYHQKFLEKNSFLEKKNPQSGNAEVFGGEQHKVRENEIETQNSFSDTQTFKQKYSGPIFKEYITRLQKTAINQQQKQNSAEKKEMENKPGPGQKRGK